ncbi:MAG: MFS transporter [Burkholderiales bacterium]
MLRAALARFFVPPATTADAGLLLAARGLRAFGDGFVSLLLPFYLALLGYGAFEIGVLVTATLLGSGLMTLGVGLIAHRCSHRNLLYAAALLMLGSGVAIVFARDFWPLCVIAFVGTLNPASGDLSVFSPLEHTLLARAAQPRSRTALFARYSLVGALAGAVGAQAAGMANAASLLLSVDLMSAIRALFVLYGALGAAVLLIYRRLSPGLDGHEKAHAPVPLGPSRGVVYRLAALFSVDAFAGGFAVQSLLALWLFDRFALSLVATGAVFFWSGVLGALSQLLASKFAARYGLVNTMVYTHIPASVFLMLVPFMPTLALALALLFLRSFFSQMDVPARTSYVMAVVTPGERPAAASITAVPRSLASALSPSLAGYLLALSSFGWPLVICGTLKIAYDLMLLRMFSKVKPPEEC